MKPDSKVAVPPGPAVAHPAYGVLVLIGIDLAAGSEEVEVVNEGIVLADVRSISLVFKRVVEHTKSAAYYELRSHLIGEADARSKIVFLRLHQPLPVLVGAAESNAILRQQGDKAGETRFRLSLPEAGIR